MAVSGESDFRVDSGHHGYCRECGQRIRQDSDHAQSLLREPVGIVFVVPLAVVVECVLLVEVRTPYRYGDPGNAWPCPDRVVCGVGRIYRIRLHSGNDMALVNVDNESDIWFYGVKEEYSWEDCSRVEYMQMHLFETS